VNKTRDGEKRKELTREGSTGKSRSQTLSCRGGGGRQTRKKVEVHASSEREMISREKTHPFESPSNADAAGIVDG